MAFSEASKRVNTIAGTWIFSNSPISTVTRKIFPNAKKSFVVDYAIGEFRVDDLSGSTRIRWTYSYHKSSILGDFFLPNFVLDTWGAYMRTVLETMKTELE